MRRAGFTLIELLAVIVILAILMAFLLTTLGGQEEAVRVNLTRTFLENVEAVVGEYEREEGDFPPSAWSSEWGAQPNATNLGAEALVVALWREEGGGVNLSEDVLVNTDEDRASRRLTVFPRRDLFELRDQWDNPIAYFHHRDYGRRDLYVTEDPETGELLESTAVARRSGRTGDWANRRTFQLLSAGPDGRFGTEDDITNFDD